MDKTINVDISVIYNWYDHLLLRENGDAEKVTKTIENGDYETFMKFYNDYNNRYTYCYDDEEYPMIFFPDTAAIWYHDEIVGDIDITTPVGFNMITDSDYECG